MVTRTEYVPNGYMLFVVLSTSLSHCYDGTSKYGVVYYHYSVRVADLCQADRDPL